MTWHEEEDKVWPSSVISLFREVLDCGANLTYGLYAGRYLFRHNYTDLNVLDIFNGINKPTIKSGYEPYINYREFQRVGSDTDWVEYLSTGKALESWILPFGADHIRPPPPRPPFSQNPNIVEHHPP